MALEEISVDEPDVASGPIRRGVEHLPGLSIRVAQPVRTYVASRVLVLGCALVSVVFVDPEPARGPWPTGPTPRLAGLQALGRWDAAWYLDIARNGYRSLYFGRSTHASEAFFPGYPLLVRALTALTGGPLLPVAVMASVVLGGATAVVIWRLVAHLAGPDAAQRATTLFCFSPGVWVMSMAYSEAMFLLATASAVLMLCRRRWWAAGACTAVASLTRSNGIALIASCAIVAAVAIWKHRDWSALAAPVLGSSGVFAYFLYLMHHSGNLWAWFDAERRGWNDHWAPVSGFLHHLVSAHPPSLQTNGLTEPVWDVFTVVGLVGLLLLVRWRPPLPVAAYGLMSTAFVAGSYQVGLRPRMLLTTFPLLLAFGVETEGRRYRLLLAASVVCLVASSILIFGTLASVP